MMATRESKKKGVFAEEDELMFSDGLCNKGLILPESRQEVFAMASTLGRLKIETPPLECIKGRRGKHVRLLVFK